MELHVAFQASSLYLYRDLYHIMDMFDHSVDLGEYAARIAFSHIIEPLCLDLWTNGCLGRFRQSVEAS